MYTCIAVFRRFENGKSDSVRLRCDALRCEAVCACGEERFCWLVFPDGNGRDACHAVPRPTVPAS